MGMLKAFCSTFYSLIVHRDRLECYLPLTKNSYLKLYERPGLWCSDEKLNDLVKDLRQVAKESQINGDVPIYGVLKGERDDLKRRVIAVAYDKKTGDPIGFSAQIYIYVKDLNFKAIILHLGLIYISPKAQGKSISYLLAVLPNILLLLKSGLRKTWVSNVSQVPAVVGLVEKNYDSVYPSSKEGVEQSFSHYKIADLIVRGHRKDFGVGEDAGYDPCKQIITNAYTGGSDELKKPFKDAPKHRDQKVNDMCERNLDYERGDDYVQIGILDIQAMLALFKNKKSKQSLVQLSVNVVIFAVFALILPLFRWVISGENLMSVMDYKEERELIYE